MLGGYTDMYLTWIRVAVPFLRTILSFDFLGIASQSSSSGSVRSYGDMAGIDALTENGHTIQVPNDWRSLFEDTETLRTLFRAYCLLPLDLSSEVCWTLASFSIH